VFTNANISVLPCGETRPERHYSQRRLYRPSPAQHKQMV
jgi:hypothetical protein